MACNLRKETQYINIPERSFLRSGYDAHCKEVFDNIQKQEPIRQLSYRLAITSTSVQSIA